MTTGPDSTPTDAVELHGLGATALIDEAVKNGVAATEPTEVGDHGLAFVVPNGFNVQTVRVTDFEDDTRPPVRAKGDYPFVGVESLAKYVSRYQGADTIAYIHDPYGKGIALLTSDTRAAFVILDDHPSTGAAYREHRATLVLRPTAAAKRWGQALATQSIDQEQFLDLIVDGISEIASPAGTLLRDLVSDLHAIRSTEVKSVIRTGGEGEIQLAENVKLGAGTGDKVTFPEQMTLVLAPFAGVGETVALDVRIKPTVTNQHVRFTLSCSGLDDQLAKVLSTIAGHITESTTLPCHWVP